MHRKRKVLLILVNCFKSAILRTFIFVFYTGNRVEVLRKNPNPPKEVEIFDTTAGLLEFIDLCLAR